MRGSYLDKMDEERQTVEEWNSHDISTWCPWEYDLIYLNDDVPELVLGPNSYRVSVHTWCNEQLYTIMDEWGYGVGGNAGYDYVPRKRIVSNSNAGNAGLEYYMTYWQLDGNLSLEELKVVCGTMDILGKEWKFIAGNYSPHSMRDTLETISK